MTMQLARFSTGGFVLHKATVIGSPCRFSAWYDEAGKLLDAEKFDARGRAYHVTEGGHAWRELTRKGPIYLTAEPREAAA